MTKIDTSALIARIKELNRHIQHQRLAIDNGLDAFCTEDTIAELQKSVISSERELQRRDKARARASAKTEAAQRQVVEDQRLRARIAAQDDQTRELANQVRRRLLVQAGDYPYCPYCDRDLDADVHLDHIYPVSRGGLSTEDNLVFVCSYCNLSKGNTPLVEFVKREGLDLAEVVERLSALGKRV